MKKEDSFVNGEHGQIYKKIDETRKELTKTIDGNQKSTLDKLDIYKDNMSKLNSNITTLLTKLDDLPCSSNTTRIRIVENKVSTAEGGFKLFSILLVIASLMAVIVRLLGFW